MPCDKCHKTDCKWHNHQKGRGNTGCGLFSGMSFLTCKSCY